MSKVTFTQERVRIPAKIGSMSLVGVSKKRPSGWGNYFDFDDGRYESRKTLVKTGNRPEVRCVNMWAEDLKALVKNGTLDDGQVEIVLFTETVTDDGTTSIRLFAVVDDPRIPKELTADGYSWYYPKMCFTGYWTPELPTARAMYAIHGDPSNEIERWIDPILYYARRGGSYDPRLGSVRYMVKNVSLGATAQDLDPLTGKDLQQAGKDAFSDVYREAYQKILDDKNS